MNLENFFPEPDAEFDFPLYVDEAETETSFVVTVDNEDGFVDISIRQCGIDLSSITVDRDTFADMTHILSDYFKNPPKVVNMNYFNPN